MNCNTTHYRANSSSVPGDPTARSQDHALARARIDLYDAVLKAAKNGNPFLPVIEMEHDLQRRGFAAQLDETNLLWNGKSGKFELCGQLEDGKYHKPDQTLEQCFTTSPALLREAEPLRDTLTKKEDAIQGLIDEARAVFQERLKEGTATSPFTEIFPKWWKTEAIALSKPPQVLIQQLRALQLQTRAANTP